MDVEFDELFVCELPVPLEPQPVRIARTSKTPVQDTVFIRISSRKISRGLASGSVSQILLDSIPETFTFETLAHT